MLIFLGAANARLHFRDENFCVLANAVVILCYVGESVDSDV